MGIYENGVRSAFRQLMRVAEHRIGQAGELGRPLATKVDDAQPPVLLVHGYGNDSRSMQAFARSLERDGFRPFTVDLPNFGYGDAYADARVVNAEVQRIRMLTGSPTVDVVGHSRGGVVARIRQQQLAGPNDTGRVVTVSSANTGLHLGPIDGIAARALPEGMQQIRRGTTLIDDLARGQAGHDTIAVGTNGIDGVLVPASSAKVEGAPFIAVDEGRRLGPFSRVGHWGMLRDDAAYEAVRGALLVGR